MNNDTNQTEITEHDISSQSIRKLAADYDLSLKQLAGVIGCTPAQIYSKTNKIGRGPALRILQLSHLMNLATGYFDSLSRAKKWFAEYNLDLDAACTDRAVSNRERY